MDELQRLNLSLRSVLIEVWNMVSITKNMHKRADRIESIQLTSPDTLKLYTKAHGSKVCPRDELNTTLTINI